MATLLDSALLLGKETTYGTPATLTRAYEAKADGWKRNVEYLESAGFRGGMETVRSDRRFPVSMGAGGTMELDLLDVGMGLVFQGLLGTSTSPAQQAATTAYEQTHTSAAGHPDVSWTAQWQRVDTSGTARNFTYHGCVATGWKLSQETGGLAVLSVDFDAEDETTDVAAGTVTYPAGSEPFKWTECVVSLDGSPVDFRSLDFSADLGLKTDRHYLRGSALKKRPVRVSVPTYEGTLTGDFDSMDLYDAFVAGDIKSLSAEWTGRTIEGAYSYSFKVECPAIQFSGETPEVAMDEVPTQPLPFRVLDNGTDPAVTVTIVSTDTDF